ncbi:MAG: hypothetical protein IJC27_09675 [Lentisphaeria bacterium]|nr:hypothetical protein [Lentisphaeria bacterium]
MLKHLKIMLAVTVFAAAWGVSAVPLITEKDGKVTMKNGKASYTFAVKGFQQLLFSEYEGVTLPFKKLAMTWRHKNGEWNFEEYGRDMPKRSYRIFRKNGEVTLELRSTGKTMELIRCFTLKGDSPALHFDGKLRVTGKNPVWWFNMFSFGFPSSDKWLFLTSTEKEGKVTPVLNVKDNPFIDKNGKIIVHGRFNFDQLREIFAAGSWNKENKTGYIVLAKPDKVMWPVRLTCNAQSKNGGISISPRAFIRGKDGVEESRAQALFIPFKGEPEQLNKKLIPEYTKELVRRHLIPSDFDNAEFLGNSSGVSFWKDLTETKVFRSTLPPAKKAVSKVQLFTAKDEGESFQLALRSNAALKNVSLAFEGFDSSIKCSWNAVEFINRTDYLGYISSITGNMPDVLSNAPQVDVAANSTQPFLVNFRVSPQAKAGKYSGKVKVLENGKELFAVPVELTVWNFSIEEPHLTAAFDVWNRPKLPDNSKAKEYFEKSLKFIMDARAGNRWLTNVKLRWDKEGNLLPVDYREFDASVEKSLKDYRQRIIFGHMFVLGWGMEPQNTWFGLKKDTLTPEWKRKVLAFAKDLRKHLIEKKWNDFIVMDIYDEPKDEHLYLLHDTVKLIHEVAPEWRFTYAGDYREALKDTIKFWNHGMTRVIPQTHIDVKNSGGELSVYNPNGYSDNEMGVHQRGSYIWLFNNNIRYIYQWTATCWGDQGNGGWDYYRCASWVVAGANGEVMSTLRLENTRNGIEDYEYLWHLKNCAEKLQKTDPEKAKEAEALIAEAGKLAWLPEGGEISVLVDFDPASFNNWHTKAGKFLDSVVPSIK